MITLIRWWSTPTPMVTHYKSHQNDGTASKDSGNLLETKLIVLETAERHHEYFQLNNAHHNLALFPLYEHHESLGLQLIENALVDREQ